MNVKPLRIFSCLLLSISWVNIKAVTIAETAVPRVQVDEMSHDKGNRLYWEPFTHSFTVKNIGGAPLALKVVSRSCGCVSDVLSDGQLPPGGTGEIRVGYGPTPSKEKHGQNSFSVVVATNDPANESFSLTVTAALIDPVHAIPNHLKLSDRETSNPVMLPVEIVCLRDGVIPELLAVEASLPQILVKHVASTDVSSDERRHVYNVSLQRNAAPNPEHATLTIRSDSKRVPIIEIPVDLADGNRVTVSPSIAALGNIRRGEEKSKALAVRWSADLVGPLTCRPEDDRVRAEFKSDPSGRSGELVVKFKATNAGVGTERLKTFVVILDGNGDTVGALPVSGVVSGTPVDKGISR